MKSLSLSLFSAVLLTACASAGGPADAPVDVSGARVSTRTLDNGDQLAEYRIAGQLRMVKVTPAKGPPYYLYDENGDGRLDNPKDRVPAVYWKLYSW